MKISGGVPWPEPSAGVFGNASRNLHFFIILVIIFSSFWSSFFHHFGLRLLHHFLGISEIRRIRSKNHKNDEKNEEKMKISGGVPWPEPSAGVFGNASRNLHLFIILVIIFSSFWSSFFHHFGLRLLHHFLGISEIRRIRSKNHKNDEQMKKK